MNCNNNMKCDKKTALKVIENQWKDVRSLCEFYLSQITNDDNPEFDLDWLLCCATMRLRGKPDYAELFEVSLWDIQGALAFVPMDINYILKLIKIKHNTKNIMILANQYAIPVMVGYQNQHENMTVKQWNRLLDWYQQVILSGRYTMPQEIEVLEATMTKDLAALNR